LWQEPKETKAILPLALDRDSLQEKCHATVAGCIMDGQKGRCAADQAKPFKMEGPL